MKWSIWIYALLATIMTPAHDAWPEQITIPANREVGYSVGPVKKGSTITLQYVSGLWKSWGNIPTENPDTDKPEKGDTARLVIAYQSAGGRPSAVLTLVPAGTTRKPFTYTFDQDYARVILRINGNLNTRNPGSVVYSLIYGTKPNDRHSEAAISAKQTQIPARTFEESGALKELLNTDSDYMGVKYSSGPMITNNPNALSLSNVIVAQSEVYVEAIGIGQTEEKATVEALRNAVQKVVGVYLDANISVMNDELVNEKILDYSAGFVDDFHKIAISNNQGMIQVTVRAKIQNARLGGRINEMFVSTTNVDGQRLFHVAESMREHADKARDLLHNIGADIPEKAIKIALGSPHIINAQSDGMVEVSVAAQFSMSPEFVERFEKAIKAVALKTERLATMSDVIPDEKHPGFVNRTGVVFKRKDGLIAYQMKPEYYWTVVASMMTDSNWIPGVAYNYYRFAAVKGTGIPRNKMPDNGDIDVHNLLQDNMPRISICFEDQEGNVVKQVEADGFGDVEFLKSETDYLAQANQHRMLYYAQGLIQFVYWGTGKNAPINARVGGYHNETVMLVPDNGYTPYIGGGYSNGKFAMIIDAQASTHVVYRFVLSNDEVKQIKRIRGQYYCPLKTLTIVGQ